MMDEQLLLSACKFSLAPQLQVVQPQPGLLVVKNVPLRTYLRISKTEWRVLELFREPHTAPQALALAIENRVCPALSEFYELVLKAEARRILIHEPLTVDPPLALNWRPRVPPTGLLTPVVTLLVLALATTVGLASTRPPELSSTGLAAGVALWALLLSLAHLLGASLLRGGDAEVYRPHVRWLPLPHFAVDAGDRQILPTPGRIAWLLLPACLVSLAAAIVLVAAPLLAPALLAGVLLLLHPFTGGALAEVATLLAKPPLRDTAIAALFQPNRRLAQRWRRTRHELLARTTWFRMTGAVIWLGALLALAEWLSGGGMVREFWRPELWPLCVAVFLAAPFTGLMIFTSREAILAVRKRHHAYFRRWRLFRSRWRDPGLPLSEAERQTWLMQSPLFRGLNPIERGELARQLKPLRHASRRTIQDFSDRPACVTLIVSGEVVVNRRLPNGRLQVLTRLAEGEIFGAHALLDAARPEVQVRTRTPVQALLLDIDVFQRLVVARLGLAAASALAIKLPCLRRLPLCRLWHPQSLERFAQLSTLVDLPTDTPIIEENDEVRYFYILVEGTAKVVRRKQLLATLRPGQFFGEISLLQNSVATSAVIAGPEARCLHISQRDFMRFLTHNYSAALELERVSSQRLGRPIFPLQQ